MDLLDVNVLINAFRPDAFRHAEYLAYVQSLVDGTQPFAVPSIVLSSFLRITTNQKIFVRPNTFEDARRFSDQLVGTVHCLTPSPGVSHWRIFMDLCGRGNASGNLVADAYLAAIAIEIGAELVTDDRGMARWPGLKWRQPLCDS